MKHTPETRKHLSETKRGNLNPQYRKGLDKYRTFEWLNQKYIVEDKSISELSKLIGIGVGGVFKWLKNAGVSSKPRGSRSGDKHNMWRGGRSKTSQGYIRIYHSANHIRRTGNYVPEHILVAESSLGRKLTKAEAIHHINEVKDDNRPKNLYLFPSESEHQRYHAFLRFGKVSRISQTNLIVK